jgi:hypothetical protein
MNKFDAVENAANSGQRIEIERGLVGPIKIRLQNGDVHEFSAVELIELRERIPDLQIPASPKVH